MDDPQSAIVEKDARNPLNEILRRIALAVSSGEQTNGVFNRLFSFDATNGAMPEATLTLGKDGNFYGTAAGGGAKLKCTRLADSWLCSSRK
jgi:hypothetical protein